MKTLSPTKGQKRLGVQEFRVGMKVRWLKGGKAGNEVLEVVKIEKRLRGKTVITFKNECGEATVSFNAGNRYFPVDQPSVQSK